MATKKQKELIKELENERDAYLEKHPKLKEKQLELDMKFKKAKKTTKKKHQVNDKA